MEDVTEEWPADWKPQTHTTPAVFRLCGAMVNDGPPATMRIGLQPIRGNGRTHWFVRKGTLYELNTYPIEALPRPIASVLAHAMTQPRYTEKRWFVNMQEDHVAWVIAHGKPV